MGRDPTLLGNQEQVRDGGHPHDLGPWQRGGGPRPAQPPTCPCTQGAFSSLLALLQSPPWRLCRAQGRALTARAEPWAGAHGCLEAAPVSSWQSQSAGGGEWAVGGRGQPAV